MAKKVIGVEVDIPVGKAEKQTESLKSKLKKLKDEIATLNEADPKFGKLVNEAAALEDKIGGINQRVRALASDTKNLEGFTATVQGIAGGFAAAQGAAALFTGENEDLQKSILKVQGALTLLNGVQELANQLNKDSAAMIFLNAKAQQLYSLVVGKSTGALKSFKLALAATGIGAALVAIGLLVENWEKVSEVLGIAEDKQKKYNDALKEARVSVEGSLISLNKYQEVVNDVNRSEEERTFALQELNKLGVATEDITLTNAEALDQLNERIEKQTKLIVARAKAEAAANLLTEATEKMLREQSKTIGENIGFWDSFKAGVLSAGDVSSLVSRTVSAGVKNRSNAINDASEEVERATKVYTDALDSLLTLEGNNIKTQNEVKKTLERRAKAEEELRKRLEERKAWEERVAQIIKETRRNIELNALDGIERELLALENSYKDKFDIVKGNEEAELLVRAEYYQARQAIEDKYMAEARKKRDEDFEKQKEEEKKRQDELLAQQKAYETAVFDLKISSSTALTQALSDINTAFAGNSEKAARKQFQIQKALSIAETVISTYSAAQKAYASQLTIPTPDAPLRATIAAAAAITQGLARVTAIAKQDFNSGTTNNVQASSGGSQAPSVNNSQTPQLNQDVTKTRVSYGQGAEQFIRVYVTEADITDRQDQVKRIIAKATVK